MLRPGSGYTPAQLVYGSLAPSPTLARRSDGQTRVVLPDDAFGAGLALTLDVADSTTLADSAVLEPALAVSDSTSLADSASRAPSLVASDAAPLADSAADGVDLAASDAAAVTDATAKTVTTDAADTVGLADAADVTLVLTVDAADTTAATDAATLGVEASAADTAAVADAATVEGGSVPDPPAGGGGGRIYRPLPKRKPAAKPRHITLDVHDRVMVSDRFELDHDDHDTLIFDELAVLLAV